MGVEVNTSKNDSGRDGGGRESHGVLIGIAQLVSTSEHEFKHAINAWPDFMCLVVPKFARRIASQLERLERGPLLDLPDCGRCAKTNA